MNEEKTQKRKSDRWIFAIVLLFLAAGVGAFLLIKNMCVPDLLSKSEITMEKTQKIRKGMDQLQVRSILGAPEDTGTATMMDFEGAVDSYQNSKQDLKVNVVFKDGKVEMMTVNQDVVELKP